MEDLELLVAAEGCDFADAVYPPGCEPRRGRLRIRPLECGAVKLEVQPSQLDTDDFRLAVLFHGGSCVFSGAADLGAFFGGPVARAFGLAVEAPEGEPPPEPQEEAEPAADLLRDLQPNPAPAPARRPAATDVTPRELAGKLAREIHGQTAALARVADAVSTQLAKRAPVRPASILLLGPTGTGKTSTIEALPRALRRLGRPGVHVFRVDCNELVHGSDLRRFLGAPPSYVGYVEEPPFFAALRKPRCIVLFDEIEKAPEELRWLLLGLLDEGRVGAPDGTTVNAPGIVVAMTSNEGAQDLEFRLRDVAAGSREEQAACRDHLLRLDWPSELVGRIGSYAVYDALGEESLRGVAERAIAALAAEYGLAPRPLPPVLADVVRDLADGSEIGARAFDYAARDLLTAAFADAAREGLEGRVRIDPGPPPRVVARVRVS